MASQPRGRGGRGTVEGRKERCAQVHVPLPRCQPKSSEVANYLPGSPSPPHAPRTPVSPSHGSDKSSLSPLSLFSPVKVVQSASQSTGACHQFSPTSPRTLLNAGYRLPDVCSLQLIIPEPEPDPCEFSTPGGINSSYSDTYELSTDNAPSKNSRNAFDLHVTRARSTRVTIEGGHSRVYSTGSAVSSSQSIPSVNEDKEGVFLDSWPRDLNQDRGPIQAGQRLTHGEEKSFDLASSGYGAKTPVNRHGEESLLFYFRSASYDVHLNNSRARNKRKGRPSNQQRSRTSSEGGGGGRSIAREVTREITWRSQRIDPEASQSALDSNPGTTPTSVSEVVPWISHERNVSCESPAGAAVVEYGPTVRYAPDEENLTVWSNKGSQTLSIALGDGPYDSLVNNQAFQPSDDSLGGFETAGPYCHCDLLCSCVLSGNHLCRSSPHGTPPQVRSTLSTPSALPVNRQGPERSVTRDHSENKSDSDSLLIGHSGFHSVCGYDLASLSSQEDTCARGLCDSDSFAVGCEVIPLSSIQTYNEELGLKSQLSEHFTVDKCPGSLLERSRNELPEPSESPDHCRSLKALDGNLGQPHQLYLTYGSHKRQQPSCACGPFNVASTFSRSVTPDVIDPSSSDLQFNGYLLHCWDLRPGLKERSANDIIFDDAARDTNLTHADSSGCCVKELTYITPQQHFQQGSSPGEGSQSDTLLIPDKGPSHRNPEDCLQTNLRGPKDQSTCLHHPAAGDPVVNLSGGSAHESPVLRKETNICRTLREQSECANPFEGPCLVIKEDKSDCFKTKKDTVTDSGHFRANEICITKLQVVKEISVKVSGPRFKRPQGRPHKNRSQKCKETDSKGPARRGFDCVYSEDFQDKHGGEISSRLGPNGANRGRVRGISNVRTTGREGGRHINVICPSSSGNAHSSIYSRRDAEIVDGQFPNYQNPAHKHGGENQLNGKCELTESFVKHDNDSVGGDRVAGSIDNANSDTRNLTSEKHNSAKGQSSSFRESVSLGQVKVRQTRASILRQLKSPISGDPPRANRINEELDLSSQKKVEDSEVRNILNVDKKDLRKTNICSGAVVARAAGQQLGSRRRGGRLGEFKSGIKMDPLAAKREPSAKVGKTKQESLKKIKAAPITSVKSKQRSPRGNEARCDANQDVVCDEESVKQVRDGERALVEEAATKGNSSLGFLRLTKSQMSKMKAPVTTRAAVVNQSTSKDKEGRGRVSSGKVISKCLRGSLEAKTNASSSSADSRNPNPRVISPLLRKASRKENISSDPGANAQSPRTRKRLVLLGVTSYPGVLSPVTSPTQSEPLDPNIEMLGKLNTFGCDPSLEFKSGDSREARCKSLSPFDPSKLGLSPHVPAKSGSASPVLLNRKLSSSSLRTSSPENKGVRVAPSALVSATKMSNLLSKTSTNAPPETTRSAEHQRMTLNRSPSFLPVSRLRARPSNKPAVIQKKPEAPTSPNVGRQPEKSTIRAKDRQVQKVAPSNKNVREIGVSCQNDLEVKNDVKNEDETGEGKPGVNTSSKMQMSPEELKTETEAITLWPIDTQQCHVMSGEEFRPRSINSDPKPEDRNSRDVMPVENAGLGTQVVKSTGGANELQAARESPADSERRTVEGGTINNGYIVRAEMSNVNSVKGQERSNRETVEIKKTSGKNVKDVENLRVRQKAQQDGPIATGKSIYKQPHVTADVSLQVKDNQTRDNDSGSLAESDINGVQSELTLIKADVLESLDNVPLNDSKADAVKKSAPRRSKMESKLPRKTMAPSAKKLVSDSKAWPDLSKKTATRVVGDFKVRPVARGGSSASTRESSVDSRFDDDTSSVASDWSHLSSASRASQSHVTPKQTKTSESRTRLSGAAPVVNRTTALKTKSRSSYHKQSSSRDVSTKGPVKQGPSTVVGRMLDSAKAKTPADQQTSADHPRAPIFISGAREITEEESCSLGKERVIRHEAKSGGVNSEGRFPHAKSEEKKREGEVGHACPVLGHRNATAPSQDERGRGATIFMKENFFSDNLPLSVIARRGDLLEGNGAEGARQTDKESGAGQGDVGVKHDEGKEETGAQTEHTGGAGVIGNLMSSKDDSIGQESSPLHVKDSGLYTGGVVSKQGDGDACAPARACCEDEKRPASDVTEMMGFPRGEPKARSSVSVYFPEGESALAGSSMLRSSSSPPSPESGGGSSVPIGVDARGRGGERREAHTKRDRDGGGDMEGGEWGEKSGELTRAEKAVQNVFEEHACARCVVSSTSGFVDVPCVCCAEEKGEKDHIGNGQFTTDACTDIKNQFFHPSRISSVDEQHSEVQSVNTKTDGQAQPEVSRGQFDILKSGRDILDVHSDWPNLNRSRDEIKATAQDSVINTMKILESSYSVETPTSTSANDTAPLDSTRAPGFLSEKDAFQAHFSKRGPGDAPGLSSTDVSPSVAASTEANVNFDEEEGSQPDASLTSRAKSDCLPEGLRKNCQSFENDCLCSLSAKDRILRTGEKVNLDKPTNLHSVTSLNFKSFTKETVRGILLNDTNPEDSLHSDSDDELLPLMVSKDVDESDAFISMDTRDVSRTISYHGDKQGPLKSFSDSSEEGAAPAGFEVRCGSREERAEEETDEVEGRHGARFTAYGMNVGAFTTALGDPVSIDNDTCGVADAVENDNLFCGNSTSSGEEDGEEGRDGAESSCSETSFQSATSDILMVAASPPSDELAHFEGCGTSKAGEGMARMIATDSENLLAESECWEEDVVTGSRDGEIHEDIILLTLEPHGEGPDLLSTMPFSSTPRGVTGPSHKHKYATALASVFSRTRVLSDAMGFDANSDAFSNSVCDTAPTCLSASTPSTASSLLSSASNTALFNDTDQGECMTSVASGSQNLDPNDPEPCDGSNMASSLSSVTSHKTAPSSHAAEVGDDLRSMTPVMNCLDNHDLSRDGVHNGSVYYDTVTSLNDSSVCDSQHGDTPVASALSTSSTASTSSREGRSRETKAAEGPKMRPPSLLPPRSYSQEPRGCALLDLTPATRSRSPTFISAAGLSTTHKRNSGPRQPQLSQATSGLDAHRNSNTVCKRNETSKPYRLVKHQLPSATASNVDAAQCQWADAQDMTHASNEVVSQCKQMDGAQTKPHPTLIKATQAHNEDSVPQTCVEKNKTNMAASKTYAELQKTHQATSKTKGQWLQKRQRFEPSDPSPQEKHATKTTLNQRKAPSINSRAPHLPEQKVKQDKGGKVDSGHMKTEEHGPAFRPVGGDSTHTILCSRPVETGPANENKALSHDLCPQHTRKSASEKTHTDSTTVPGREQLVDPLDSHSCDLTQFHTAHTDQPFVFSPIDCPLLPADRKDDQSSSSDENMPTSAASGSRDIKTSLFESGYSSDIKSPNVRSPTLDMEDNFSQATLPDCYTESTNQITTCKSEDINLRETELSSQTDLSAFTGIQISAEVEAATEMEETKLESDTTELVDGLSLTWEDRLETSSARDERLGTGAAELMRACDSVSCGAVSRLVTSRGYSNSQSSLSDPCHDKGEMSRGHHGGGVNKQHARLTFEGGEEEKVFANKENIDNEPREEYDHSAVDMVGETHSDKSRSENDTPRNMGGDNSPCTKCQQRRSGNTAQHGEGSGPEGCNLCRIIAPESKHVCGPDAHPPFSDTVDENVWTGIHANNDDRSSSVSAENELHCERLCEHATVSALNTPSTHVNAVGVTSLRFTEGYQQPVSSIYGAIETNTSASERLEKHSVRDSENVIETASSKVLFCLSAGQLEAGTLRVGAGQYHNHGFIESGSEPPGALDLARVSEISDTFTSRLDTECLAFADDDDWFSYTDAGSATAVFNTNGVVKSGTSTFTDESREGNSDSITDLPDDHRVDMTSRKAGVCSDGRVSIRDAMDYNANDNHVFDTRGKVVSPDEKSSLGVTRGIIYSKHEVCTDYYSVKSGLPCLRRPSGNVEVSHCLSSLETSLPTGTASVSSHASLTDSRTFSDHKAIDKQNPAHIKSPPTAPKPTLPPQLLHSLRQGRKLSAEGLVSDAVNDQPKFGPAVDIDEPLENISTEDKRLVKNLSSISAKSGKNDSVSVCPVTIVTSNLNDMSRKQSPVLSSKETIVTSVYVEKRNEIVAASRHDYVTQPTPTRDDAICGDTSAEGAEPLLKGLNCASLLQHWNALNACASPKPDAPSKYLSPSPHPDHPPKEKSPFILEKVCELLSKISKDTTEVIRPKSPMPTSEEIKPVVPLVQEALELDTEKERGVRVVKKWKSMIKKSRVVAIRDSLKVKMSSGQDEGAHTLTATAPLSPTPQRKYKWARGDAGIWKKVYLDENGKVEAHNEINDVTSDEMQTSAASSENVDLQTSVNDYTPHSLRLSIVTDKSDQDTAFENVNISTDSSQICESIDPLPSTDQTGTTQTPVGHKKGTGWARCVNNVTVTCVRETVQACDVDSETTRLLQVNTPATIPVVRDIAREEEGELAIHVKPLTETRLPNSVTGDSLMREVDEPSLERSVSDLLGPPEGNEKSVVQLSREPIQSSDADIDDSIRFNDTDQPVKVISSSNSNASTYSSTGYSHGDKHSSPVSRNDCYSQAMERTIASFDREPGQKQHGFRDLEICEETPPTRTDCQPDFGINVYDRAGPGKAKLENVTLGVLVTEIDLSNATEVNSDADNALVGANCDTKSDNSEEPENKPSLTEGGAGEGGSWRKDTAAEANEIQSDDRKDVDVKLAVEPNKTDVLDNSLVHPGVLCGITKDTIETTQEVDQLAAPQDNQDDLIIDESSDDGSKRKLNVHCFADDLISISDSFNSKIVETSNVGTLEDTSQPGENENIYQKTNRDLRKESAPNDDFVEKSQVKRDFAPSRNLDQDDGAGRMKNYVVENEGGVKKQQDGDEQKTKKYSWPTVAESLKRFQKSIAAAPPRSHLQRGRDQQYLLASRKSNAEQPSVASASYSPTLQLCCLAKQTCSETLPAVPAVDHVGHTSQTEESGPTQATSPEHKPAILPPIIDMKAIARKPTSISGSSWVPPSVPEQTLPPSPVIVLSPGTAFESATKLSEKSSAAAIGGPVKTLPSPSELVCPSLPNSTSSTSTSSAIQGGSAASSTSSHAYRPSTIPIPGPKELNPEQPFIRLPDRCSQASLPGLSSQDSSSEPRDALLSTQSEDSARAPMEDQSMISPRSKRNLQSAKLISVSVWDTHDGDKNLRPCRRLWTPEEKPILAGISEIEEVHGGQEGPLISHDDLDPAHLHVTGDCKERVRASRSPVRPQAKKKTSRRSLSLPSGGLSYGDVKIMYKDGHFVTVGAQATSADKQEGNADEANEAKVTLKRNAGSSCLKEVNEDLYDQEGNMRAEILSLLEEGISDAQQLDYNRWDDGGGGGGEISRRVRAGAPIFLSLPRRRQKGSRPNSADEGQLLRSYSKSQQSLVCGILDRDNEDESARPPEGSTLKRNKSFTEAMGSNLTLNEAERAPEPRDHESADLCDSGFDDQRLTREDSSSQKTRAKGGGFIQRMLKKRRGSEKSSKEDLTSSSLSLASTSSTAPTSPTKREPRDASLTRKMSFRGIFKRKNSSDWSGKKISTPDEQEGQSVALCDAGLVPSQMDTLQRRALTDIGESDLHRGEAYEQARSLSPTPSATRSPLSGSSSQSSLQPSLLDDDNDRTPTADYFPVVHRRPRSASGRSARHAHGASSRLSGDSFSEYDFSSQEFQTSDDALTPRSFSPSVMDITAEGERTLVPSPASPGDRLSPCIYQTLASSPQGARRRLSREYEGGSQGSSSNRVSSSSSLSGDKGEITSSNSNDSGIQNDVNVTSSSESVQASVRLRKSKSPSPATERPKSDITVRWADLLEQVMDAGGVKHRKEAGKLRKRPRPKSDIDESQEDDGLDKEDSAAEEEEYDDADADMADDDMADDDVVTEGDSDLEGGCHMLESRRPVAMVNASSLACIAGGSSGDVGAMNSAESAQSLVELRRSARGDKDVLSAKLAKFRRLSTPQPITLHAEKPAVKPCKTVQVFSNLKQACSMPDNLDKLSRKKHYFSLIGSDAQSISSQHSGGDESSDESEYSVEYPEKSYSTRTSQAMLAALDQLYEHNLTYAEALWDHVTMDPDELGFRAGDLICVTDASNKHWWFGVLDGREGWFPTNYVRLRVNQDIMEEELSYLLAEKEEMVVPKRSGGGHMGVAPTSSLLDKNQARANVVNEILGAEKDYVKHLRDVVEGYVKQARKRPEMFPTEKVAVIFSNIEDIYLFATQLLDSLQRCVNPQQPHLSEIGQCFLEKVKGFEMYSDYCNNHPAACEELRELYRNKRYRHFFEACRLLQEMIEIPLEGFLLTPVQKICKYHLQLAELFKFTPADHPDYRYVAAALEAMKKIATLINERKRKMESIEKLAAWQLLVDDWEGPDILVDSSELIYSGELNKINHAGWSQERYFFLFDHQLIYCKKDLLKKSSFCYKGRIYMDRCRVYNMPDGRDSQYNVSVRNAWKLHDTHKDKWYLLVAKTAVVKQRWIKAFQDERRRVKDDAENNFNIPAHVKQAVINNFKQKTNHNKPKGKKFTRTTSAVSAIATLPRAKGPHNVKSDSSLGKSRKNNWFFLGKGKS